MFITVWAIQMPFAPGVMAIFTRVGLTLFPTETLGTKYITQNSTHSIRVYLTMQGISYLLSSKKVTCWTPISMNFKQMGFNWEKKRKKKEKKKPLSLE